MSFLPLHYAIGIIVFVAIAVLNATTVRRLDGFDAPASLEFGLGWPATAVSAFTDVEQENYNYFTNTEQVLHSYGFRIQLLGAITNIGISLLLMRASVAATQRILAHLRPQFTIASLLGIVTFVALDIATRWDWLHRFSVPDWMSVELALNIYCAKIVWLAVLAACLYTSHWIAARLLNGPTKTTEPADAREPPS